MSQEVFASFLPALAVGLVLGIVVAIAWASSWRGLRHERQQLAAQRRELDQLLAQVRALAAGAAGMAGALARVEQQVRRVGDRQQELELRNPGEQLYEHALQLIRNGADAEELMNRCGLVRDEAELLLRMHRYRQAG